MRLGGGKGEQAEWVGGWLEGAKTSWWESRKGGIMISSCVHNTLVTDMYMCTRSQAHTHTHTYSHNCVSAGQGEYWGSKNSLM